MEFLDFQFLQVEDSSHSGRGTFEPEILNLDCESKKAQLPGRVVGQVGEERP
jgi:hypothetical protein